MDTKELASSIRTIVSAVHKTMRKQVYSANTYSMTELETIALLNRNPSLLPTELAKLTRVKTQSMSQILKKLEEQGIIKRTPSKQDKRKVYISITAFGKKIIEDSRDEKDEWLRTAIEKSFTEKEKDLVIKVLPLLNKLVEMK